MNLSKQTIEVLKNFATINQGILFKEGNVIRTMSVMRNIFARAVVKDVVPQEFAIYDLPEFLSCMSLFDNPSMDFQERMVEMCTGNNKVKYFYSSPNVVIAPPDKEMRMKGVDLSFTITEAELLALQKASAVMKLKDLAITKAGVSVLNTDADGNRYDISLAVNTELEDPRVVIKVDDLKIIPSDYEVNVATAGMIQFVSKNPALELEYFIAIQS